MTVEAIATGAGISRGSLYFYFYFGSKQDVLTALVARTVAVLTVDARAASGDVGSSPQDIVRNARTEKMWREHGRVMRAAVDLSSAVPEIGALWDTTMVAYIDAMTRILVGASIAEGTGGDRRSRPGPHTVLDDRTRPLPSLADIPAAGPAHRQRNLRRDLVPHHRPSLTDLTMAKRRRVARGDLTPGSGRCGASLRRTP
jgi:AcrR family transcriptional regulator